MIDINNFDIETTVIDATTREEALQQKLYVVKATLSGHPERDYMRIEYTHLSAGGKVQAVTAMWPDEFSNNPESLQNWYIESINIAAGILEDGGFTVMWSGLRKHLSNSITAYILVKENKSVECIKTKIIDPVLASMTKKRIIPPRKIIADKYRHLIEVKKLAPRSSKEYVPQIRYKSLLNLSFVASPWDNIIYPNMHELIITHMEKYMRYTILGIGYIKQDHYIVAVAEDDEIPNIWKNQRIKSKNK